MIREGTGRPFFDRAHLRAVVMPYPVGHEINLPSGRIAVDIHVPDCPTVRVMGSVVVEEFAVDMTAGVERVVA